MNLIIGADAAAVAARAAVIAEMRRRAGGRKNVELETLIGGCGNRGQNLWEPCVDL